MSMVVMIKAVNPEDPEDKETCGGAIIKLEFGPYFWAGHLPASSELILNGFVSKMSIMVMIKAVNLENPEDYKTYRG